MADGDNTILLAIISSQQDRNIKAAGTVGTTSSSSESSLIAPSFPPRPPPLPSVNYEPKTGISKGFVEVVVLAKVALWANMNRMG